MFYIKKLMMKIQLFIFVVKKWNHRTERKSDINLTCIFKLSILLVILNLYIMRNVYTSINKFFL